MSMCWCLFAGLKLGMSMNWCLVEGLKLRIRNE